MSGSQTTSLISGGNVVSFPTSNGLFPNEGPRVFTSQYSWNSTIAPASSSYYEDLTSVINNGGATTLQTIYVDNSQCAFAAVITIASSGQTIVVSAYEVMLYPAFFTGTPGFTISSIKDGLNNTTNKGYTKITITNVPMETLADPVFYGIPPMAGSNTFSQIGLAPLSNIIPININLASPTTRFVLLGIQINVRCQGAPTANSACTFNVFDGAVTNIGAFPISFAAGDLSFHSVGLTGLGYVSIARGNNMFVQYNSLPNGATAMDVTINTQYTLY